MKSERNYPAKYSFGHRYHERHLQQMNCLGRIRLPNVLILTSILVFAGLTLGVASLWLPWVQTTTGMGRVTTLNPADRVQTLNATVSGRIAQWYVREADTVKAGDPIVRIEDLDTRLVPRLEALLEATSQRVQAAREAVATAEIDYGRQQQLFEEGLASRLEYEQSGIRVRELRGALAEARSAFNEAEVSLSRQSSQLVRAPRDGTVLTVEAGDNATLVNAGQTLATFMPAQAERAVELFINGRDVGLVLEGRRVRLQFEGWPAFQFSGFPEMSVGTFAGEVMFIEPSARPDGRFRVLIRETTDDTGCKPAPVAGGVPRNGGCGWPPESFIRLGANVRGWILLETVPLGYEIWRLLNNFPPVNNGNGTSQNGNT